jgi:hypothetical protein
VNQLTLSVKINGVYRTINVPPRSLTITNALTDEVDTCSFTFETSNINEKPIEGQEVIIAEGTEATITGYKKIFGGHILSAPESEEIAGQFVYQVECVDYQRQLDKKLVSKNYSNMYAGDIVKDIATNYCPGFTLANVSQGVMVKYISFKYNYPGDCFKQLSDLTGYNWYVDQHRDIHFFDQFKNLAPFNLDDSQTNFENLEIEADISQLRNRVYFRGGTYLSDPFTETQTGGKDVWIMGYSPHEMSITVNGVVATVGTEHLHNPANYDFLVNYQEKHVIPGAKATTASDVIKFTYKYNVPVLTVQDDTDSIQRMKDLEGGDGIYEHIIVDKEVESKDLARQLSQADLDFYSNPLLTGSFTTNNKGLRSGQLIHIKQSNRNIDRSFLIRKVTMKWLTVNKFLYQVEVASKLKGLEDLLIQLFNKSRQIEVREDEVLDKLLVLRDKAKFSDNLTISTGSPESRIGYARIGYGEIGA